MRWAAWSGTFRTPESAAVAASLLVTGGLIFVPYLLWSLLLPWLCDLQQARGENLSRTYGWNTLSFLAGVLLFGWALQYVNPFFAARAFALCAAAGLTLLSLSGAGRPVRRPILIALAAALAVGLLAVPRTLEMRLIGGGQAEGYRGGPWRSTPQHFFWVRDNRDRTRSLMFDGHSMSASAATGQIYMRAMAHVPLLLHPDPKRALLICFGVGMTADAIRTHATIEHVDVVDLNPSVYFLNRWFAPWNGDVLVDPRLRLYADDGRPFLEAAAESWDFVTMEPPPPLQPGISRLYSLEFYDAVRRHLRPGGIASQWLPEYQMDERGADLVVATFVKSFPNAFLFVGVGRELILVGSNEPFGFRGLGARLSRRARGARGPRERAAWIRREPSSRRSSERTRACAGRGRGVPSSATASRASTLCRSAARSSGNFTGEHVAGLEAASRVRRARRRRDPPPRGARRGGRRRAPALGSVRSAEDGPARIPPPEALTAAVPRSRPSPVRGASSLPRSPTGPSRARRGRPPRGAAARRA